MTVPLPKAAVVVVNYGSSELLAANLPGVVGSGVDLDVVIVDNYSSATELAAVEALCREHGWQLVSSERNVGFGAGMNRGVAAASKAGAQQFLLLNPDARIDPISLRRLREEVAAEPMSLAAPVIVTPQGRIWFDGSDLYLDRGRTRATRKRPAGMGERVRPWLTGACLMVSRRLWEAVDGFDERYFLYWEDVDLSWRVLDQGGALRVVRAATAIHAEGGTHTDPGARARSSTYYYYNIRNRLIFAGHHLDPAGRRRWARSAVGEAYDIVARGGRRQLLTPRPWWAAVRGTADGLRAMRAQAGTETAAARPVRVLQSFPQPRATTNPYIWMLKDCLEKHPSIDLSTFSWRTALTGRYDVFHAHWPEILVSGRSPVKEAARQALFLALLTRMHLGGTAIVRTVHNLELPQGISRREVALLRLLQRRTTLLISINTSTPLGDRPQVTITHGHYRDWFRSYPPAAPVPGRVGYFGLIRRYKGVDTLLRAFGELSDHSELSLFIGGKASSRQLQAELTQLATSDPRVECTFAFLTDAELVRAATSSELVVLPYRDMHNSGGVLAALSLNRPVLVPENEVNRRLAQEVGPGWVHTYPDRLSGADLLRALDAVRDASRGCPDLSARDWDKAADQHLAAYRRAISLRRTRSGP